MLQSLTVKTPHQTDTVISGFTSFRIFAFSVRMTAKVDKMIKKRKKNADNFSFIILLKSVISEFHYKQNPEFQKISNQKCELYKTAVDSSSSSFSGVFFKLVWGSSKGELLAEFIQPGLYSNGNVQGSKGTSKPQLLPNSSNNTLKHGD